MEASFRRITSLNPAQLNRMIPRHHNHIVSADIQASACLETLLEINLFHLQSSNLLLIVELGGL